MNRIIKALNHEEKGFTLIELIVVIAILGILAAIAIPQYTGTLAKVKEKADIQTANVIADAAARYLQDYQVSDIPQANNPPDGHDGKIQTLVDNGYLDSYPTAQSGATFTISVNGNTVEVKNGSNSFNPAVTKKFTKLQ